MGAVIAQSDVHPANLYGLRILLVEDDAMVAMLIEGMLDALGCQVVGWVASVPDALEAIDTNEFDGSLLDMNLSGRVVYPVADVLASRHMPFVFVTGYGRTAEAQARFPDVLAWQQGYSVREYAGEVTAPILPAVKRG
jgi:CheY-like chemotaxis protein